jgi:predicted nucleic-acid-binding Zn-ribbon protein
MRLDPESKFKIKQWLDSKVGEDPACRMCGASALFAMSISLLPNLSNIFTGAVEGQAVVNLQCGNCGYCHLFDVAPMGVSLPIG